MRPAAPAVVLALLGVSVLLAAGCDMDAAYQQSFGFMPNALPVAARPISATPGRLARPIAAATPILAPAPAAPRLTGSPIVLATDATFDRELATSPVPVVVNFTAKWCGPCHGVGNTLDQLAREQGGRVKVIRVDFDQSPATVKRYGISALPAVLMVRDGAVVKRMVGSQSRDSLASGLRLIAP